MQLPHQLLDSLAGIAGFDKEAFVQIHESGQQITSIRLNPGKLVNGEWSMVNNAIPPVFHQQLQFSSASKIPWSSYGYYLPERPAFAYRGTPRELADQAVLFSLRAVGLTDEAIARHYDPAALHEQLAALFPHT